MKTVEDALLDFIRDRPEFFATIHEILESLDPNKAAEFAAFLAELPPHLSRPVFALMKVKDLSPNPSTT